MISRFSCVLTICGLCLFHCSSGRTWEEQDTGSTSPPAKIADVAWIAGHWQGEALGGRFEETWNPPLGETMIGMFKSLQGEQTRFYELLTIGPAQDSLVLRLKHFGPDLVGWEEKDETLEFPLVEFSDSEAVFKGLTFRRISSDEMHIIVQVGDAPETRKLKFECHRAKPAQIKRESKLKPEAK